jgi:hypothetical protein
MARKLTFVIARDHALARVWRMDNGKLIDEDDGRFPVESKLLTSTEIEYNTALEFGEVVQEFARAGAGLLKGHLITPLIHQSRAGMTQRALHTDWLHLDYDRNDGFDSREEFLAAIDPALEGVSYLFKHSASAGVRCEPGLRGHYFILLDRPVSDQSLRLWLQRLNLSVPELRVRCRLSSNGMALGYPLDISTNENSKLHLIAPPRFIGFDDPLPNRFEFVQRGSDFFLLEPKTNKQQIRSRENELINELRGKAGLEPRRPRYGHIGEIEIIENPDECAVTGRRDCGDFWRLNLNGGDSWAYWHWKARPEILRNFKGEPCCKLEQIAPDWYAEAVAAAPGMDGRRPDPEARLVPFVFRDPTSDTYFNGVYNETTGALIALNAASSKGKLNDFLVQYGYPRQNVIRDWTVEFNPTTLAQVDFERRWVNKFRPPPLLRTVLTFDPPEEISEVPTIPPTILRLLRHVCVDQGTMDRFLNWLAYILQTRQKTQTAWIFQGTEGTGKGSLFHQLLVPLFGMDHCYFAKLDTVEDRFNGYLDQNLFFWLDEANVKSSTDGDRMIDSFKNLITEPVISVRRMRQNPINLPNYTNVILASNRPLPIRLPANDRRYNVAPRQEARLLFGPGEYERIQEELVEFAWFLRRLDVVESAVHLPYENEARHALILTSLTSSEDMFRHIIDGRLEWFTNQLMDSVPFPHDHGYREFEPVIRRWLESTLRGENVLCLQEDLMAVYRYVTGNDKITPIAFGKWCAANGLEFQRRRVDGNRGRFLELKFLPSEILQEEWEHLILRGAPLDDKVVPIRSARPATPGGDGCTAST